MTAAPVQLYAVQFKDEAPAIGSGLRFVFVKQGHKWVYLLSPYALRTCRVRRQVWDKMHPVEITDPDTIGRVRKVLAENPRRAPTRLAQQALGDGT